jgi:osmotically-inducible protein OsmY
MSIRIDCEIARTIENMLWWSGYWRRNEIRVVVADGWATLSGEVEWGYQKRLAVHVLRGLAGMTGMTDDIVVAHARSTVSGASEAENPHADVVTSSRWS